MALTISSAQIASSRPFQPVRHPVSALRAAFQPSASVSRFGCSDGTETPSNALSSPPTGTGLAEAETNGVFDFNKVRYQPDAIYHPSGTLTVGQKICDFLIRQVYQRPTRSTIYKWLGNPCPYKRKAQKLSCSEYTLVAIHRFGVIRGIWLGAKRLLRCNPLTVIRGHYEDPPVQINAIPWRFLPQV
jgi:putative component of membrane protein insertase Oxa1/YidC/SpoIIIJ protein YidD